ncbi:MAG: uracil-DNA glycosylase family protein [Actinomycetota bacterium]
MDIACASHALNHVTKDELSPPRDRYAVELPRRLDAVFRANPELYDHRPRFPWVRGCLGEPCAPIWFVAENPSFTQAKRARKSRKSTREDQWNVSPGDKLFRRQLVTHGFKTGRAESPGGWRCYITDVIKGVVRVKEWNSLRETEREKVAEAWARVLAWELELGRPKLIVSVGDKADRLLDHLLRRRLIPPLPHRMKIYHYSYIGSRPDARTGLGPGHPDRIAAWSEQFAAVRAALVEDAPAQPLPDLPPIPKETNPMTKTPGPSRTSDPIEVPAVVRDGIRAGLTPDQISARNGNSRAIHLAAILEEATQQGELAAFEPTPANVEQLRDKHEHRWERIAVRVFGDPRCTRETKDLYDEAKGREGAAQESYTGRGRRFPKMRS